MSVTAQMDQEGPAGEVYDPSFDELSDNEAFGIGDPLVAGAAAMRVSL